MKGGNGDDKQKHGNVDGGGACNNVTNLLW